MEKQRIAVALHYNSSECLLYALKTSSMLLWTTKQDGISITKSRREETKAEATEMAIV